jgi:hypothetical protein
MRFIRPEKKTITAILMKRGVIFLAVMLLLTGFLYAAGTAQGFTDQTQLLLLGLALTEGLVLAMGALYGMVSHLWLFLRNRNRRVFLGIGAYIALGLFGMLISALAAFILVLAGGNIL